ncbi:MAG: ion transporter [Methanoregulaceae archaeon]|nr:ion transporter [Methanoregulaceae archaeon]
MTEKLTGNGRIKSRVFGILEETPKGDRSTLLVQVTIALVVILNTVAVVIFTIPSVEASWSTLLNGIITFCLVVFAIEYLLRIWSCTDAGTWQERMSERFRYATSFHLIIDLLSIIPLLFPIFFATDFALLRGFRLISIFKLGRYARKSESLALLKRVVLKKQEIFTIMVFFLVFVILFSATIMYLVENPVQPEKFSSIPASIWWAMMTVTTVGYGDIYPVTPLGQAFGSLITLAGVLLLALPSAILASGFIEERQKKRDIEHAELSGEVLAQLERAANLWEKGLITEKEYEELKDRIMYGSGK